MKRRNLCLRFIFFNPYADLPREVIEVIDSAPPDIRKQVCNKGFRPAGNQILLLPELFDFRLRLAVPLLQHIQICGQRVSPLGNCRFQRVLPNNADQFPCRRRQLDLPALIGQIIRQSCFHRRDFGFIQHCRIVLKLTHKPLIG